MFEAYDFEYLVDAMLSKVSDELDKREGSVIYDAVAPAALELANFYIALDMVINEVFADSASYYYLIKRAAERGMYPKEETCAVGKMTVTPSGAGIAAGDRFNLDTLNYSVISPINGEPGAYRIQCETAGTAGNQQTGTLLPIEYIEGLKTAELTEILVPGEEEEDIEAFRERYFASFSSEAFGGNKADYITKVNGINGVGGCKVYRAWEGSYSPSSMIPQAAVRHWFKSQSEASIGAEAYRWLNTVYNAACEKLLTLGGTVKIIVISSELKAPSPSLIDAIQQEIDPSAGEGDGTAPIGHVVNVCGVRETAANFKFFITYDEGYSFSSMKESIEIAVDAYFEQLKQEWAANSSLTVRISQIETRLLSLKGIVDVADTLINGKAENLTLDGDCIPVRGDVVG